MGITIMQKTSLLFSAAAITLTLMASSASAATPTAAQNEATSTVKQEITEGINRYLYSIDKADPTLGKQLFYVSPETSFIHPRGHERGWSQIAENFYGTTRRYLPESFPQDPAPDSRRQSPFHAALWRQYRRPRRI
ncbi:hypothetical protein IBK87_001250 [Salmonella enterica]|nr:hypothetical protein [Salmonella enterica]EDN7108259.1 hypothetical protein [Salmonella enterica subsp. enterica serovar Hadar]EJJ1099758.1 hypothetical protein [Salmonella enterica subsp. enterica]EDX0574986.1 hypothetical protein [Salmonella enterica]EDZ6300142.1 hypothetical protein [Salmonella enterica subsp. enterica serovar Hadar]